MKKAIGILAALSLCLLATTAFAEDTTTVKGFYDIGTAVQNELPIQSVTVTPKSNAGTVTSSSVDVDSDQTAETFFEGSDRLDVTYAAADTGSYYGAILVEGTGLPTEDNTIFYIDQVTAESGSVSFNVFPKEPEQTTALTLYISSNAEGHDLISVPLNYAIATISDDSGSGGGDSGDSGSSGEGGDSGDSGSTVTPPVGDGEDDDEGDTGDGGDTGNTITASGFYNIRTTENVTTTVKGETGTITSISQDINADETADTFYPSSDRIEVTYSAATSGSYYGVVLSNGTTVPTVSSDIYYINQATASGTSVNFNVYPMLPTATTDMTLFISSNAEGHTLVSVPISYAKDVTVTIPDAPQYELGKVNADDVVDAADALLVLEFAAKLQTPTAIQELAANVNGDTVIDAADALKILEYAAKLITSWN